MEMTKSEYLVSISFNKAGEFGPEDKLAEMMTDMVSVQRELPTIKKDNTVKNKSGQKMYKFADISDILSAIKPILAEHNLFITQNVYDDNEVIGVQTILYHGSGCKIVGTPFVRQVSNTLANGNVMQNIGSMISYQRKQQVIAILGLSLENEDDEANNYAGYYGNGSYGHYSNNNVQNAQQAQQQAQQQQARQQQSQQAQPQQPQQPQQQAKQQTGVPKTDLEEKQKVVDSYLSQLGITWAHLLKLFNMNSDITLENFIQLGKYDLLIDKLKATLEQKKAHAGTK